MAILSKFLQVIWDKEERKKQEERDKEYHSSVVELNRELEKKYREPTTRQRECLRFGFKSQLLLVGQVGSSGGNLGAAYYAQAAAANNVSAQHHIMQHISSQNLLVTAGPVAGQVPVTAGRVPSSSYSTFNASHRLFDVIHEMETGVWDEDVITYDYDAMKLVSSRRFPNLHEVSLIRLASVCLCNNQDAGAAVMVLEDAGYKIT